MGERCCDVLLVADIVGIVFTVSDWISALTGCRRKGEGNVKRRVKYFI
jgi:hypothetical protein